MIAGLLAAKELGASDVVIRMDSKLVIEQMSGRWQVKHATMRQLARWYDVDIVYESQVPSINFGGEMKRDLNLSQVLKGLGRMGVRFRIEGKTLFVLP